MQLAGLKLNICHLTEQKVIFELGLLGFKLVSSLELKTYPFKTSSTPSQPKCTVCALVLYRKCTFSRFYTLQK